MQIQYSRCCGIEVHKDSATVCVLVYTHQPEPEVLMSGDLRGVARARRLSQTTVRNIRRNLFFAFVYNSIGVPIAAGILYPFFGLVLSPMIASAAMTFSSVSVIAKALR
jgi:cation transport ATPase